MLVRNRRDLCGRFSVPAFELNPYLISEACRIDRKPFTRAAMKTMLIYFFKFSFALWNSMKNGNHEENHNLKVQCYRRRDFSLLWGEKKKREVMQKEAALNIEMLELKSSILTQYYSATPKLILMYVVINVTLKGNAALLYILL